MAGKLLTLTAVVFAAAAVSNMSVQAAGPGDGKTINPMGTGRPDHQLIYEIIETGLEQLGYENAEMLTGAYPAIHLSVGQGDADYTAVHWKPLHNDYFANSGSDDALIRLGPTYTSAMQGYFIDKATSEKHGITKLEQLKDASVKALFDTDGDGKANLTGCNPGWGCEKVIEHHLDAYELRDHVNNDKGEYFALLADTIERYKSGNPIFYTAWAPSWMMSVLKPGDDVVFLDAPFSSLPGNDNANTEMADGRNPGFGSNDNYILANKQFAEENPAAAAFLAALRIPIADLNAGMDRINNGEKSPEQIKAIAADWIKANQAQFDAWVAEAAKKGG